MQTKDFKILPGGKKSSYDVMNSQEFIELVYLAAETYANLHGNKLSPLDVVKEMYQGNTSIINAVLHLLDAVSGSNRWQVGRSCQ